MSNVVDFTKAREEKIASLPPPPCPKCQAPMIKGKDSEKKVWVCVGCLVLKWRD